MFFDVLLALPLVSSIYRRSTIGSTDPVDIPNTNHIWRSSRRRWIRDTGERGTPAASPIDPWVSDLLDPVQVISFRLLLPTFLQGIA